MNTVLVTGAAGFIGRQALRPLAERGFDVHALLGPGDEELPGVRAARVDLHDAVAVTRLVAALRPSHLLHFAWYTQPGAFWRSPENLRWVGTSLALLHAFADAGGRRAVLAGSCAEYDWSGGACSERSTPLVPKSLYGACKLAVARVTEAYGPVAGVSTAWGRVFFLYGPHEKPGRLVSDVVAALVGGRPVPCTEGSQRRDFLHVADVAAAFAALLDSAVEGPVNIGSGEVVAVRDLVGLLADQVGGRELLDLGALPARQDDPALIVADIGRLRDEVGWRPRFTLAEGLADTIAWHRARGVGA